MAHAGHGRTRVAPRGVAAVESLQDSANSAERAGKQGSTRGSRGDVPERAGSAVGSFVAVSVRGRRASQSGAAGSDAKTALLEVAEQDAALEVCICSHFSLASFFASPGCPRAGDFAITQAMDAKLATRMGHDEYQRSWWDPISADSTAYQRWHSFLALTALFTIFVTPVRLAFKPGESNVFIARLQLCLDGIFMLNMGMLRQPAHPHQD